MQVQHTSHRKHIHKVHPKSASLTWDKHYSFFLNVTKNTSPNALGSISEADVIVWDLPNAFISSCIFPGKGRMELNPLSRNPRSAFWQRAKVGTKKLGMAMMQCMNYSRGKALALLRHQWLYPTHSNKEQDRWLLPFSASKRRQCKTNHNQDQVSSSMNYIPYTNLSYIWMIYFHKVATATSQDINGVSRSHMIF